MRTFVMIGIAATVLVAASPSLEEAHKHYNRTDYESALKILNAIPEAERSGRVYDLMGRSYFMQGEFKKAGEAYEKALAAEPGNSVYAHGLGKAYGKRAETSNPFSAPGLASKARQNFEKAVQYDSRNIEAMNDLFEYYLEAPGFLGGGLDKASALAQRIAALDSVEGHWARAKIAEKRKEFSTAEVQLRTAVDAAPAQVGRVVDLAKFLAKQGRHQEAEQVFQQAEHVAPGSPRLLFDRAEIYVHSGRNLDTARMLLKQYLSKPLTPDDPPRQEAEKLLKVAGG